MGAFNQNAEAVGRMSSRVANKHSSAAAASSVFFSQHDRDHALGDRGIGWIGGVVRKGLVEVDPMSGTAPNHALLDDHFGDQHRSSANDDDH